jgi:hypothetical protein
VFGSFAMDPDDRINMQSELGKMEKHCVLTSLIAHFKLQGLHARVLGIMN